MLLLVILCATYSVNIILGISFVISISNHIYSFSGHCLLFSTGKYEDNGDFTPYWSSRFGCIFTILVAILSNAVASYELVNTSVMLYKGTRETFVIIFKKSFWALTVSTFILLSAIVISAGFAVWCRTVEERFSKGCEAAAASMIISNNTQHISINGFFTDLETSQFSIWSSFVVWVLALTISGRMLFVAHELANIRISMARERRRYNLPPDHANQPSNLPYRDIT